VQQISTSSTIKDRQERGALEPVSYLSAKRNLFSKAKCSQCDKAKITFTIHFKPLVDSTEDAQEAFCVKCLTKRIPKKQLHCFIASASGVLLDEEFNVEIKQLGCFKDYCKLKNRSDPDNSFLSVVNLIFREKVKSLLLLNSEMVQVVQHYQNEMRVLEKVLCMKLVSDNTDCILKLDNLIREPNINKKMARVSEAEQLLLTEAVRKHLSSQVSHDNTRETHSMCEFNMFNLESQVFSHLGKRQPLRSDPVLIRFHAQDHHQYFSGDQEPEDRSQSESDIRTNFLNHQLL